MCHLYAPMGAKLILWLRFPEEGLLTDIRSDTQKILVVKSGVSNKKCLCVHIIKSDDNLTSCRNGLDFDVGHKNVVESKQFVLMCHVRWVPGCACVKPTAFVAQVESVWSKQPGYRSNRAINQRSESPLWSVLIIIPLMIFGTSCVEFAYSLSLCGFSAYLTFQHSAC